MLRTKVSCWFCSKESSVFILNKNSWTCEHCEQYNGFKKDGDYNKKIPEMEANDGKIFCTNPLVDHQKSTTSTNLLCDKCNRNQELKLADLNKFEPKNEDNFEEEYRIYKLKMDQIYGLCQPCTYKLNNYLKKQDLQIGDYLVKTRRSNATSAMSKVLPTSKSNGISSMNGKSQNVVVATSTVSTITAKTAEPAVTKASARSSNGHQVRHRQTNGGTSNNNNNTNSNKLNDTTLESMETSFSNPVGDDILNKSRENKFFQKAYTIAGTVPTMMYNSTRKALNNISIMSNSSILNTSQQSNANLSQNGSFINLNDEGDDDVNDNKSSSNSRGGSKLSAKVSRRQSNSVSKFNFSSIGTVLIDLLLLFLTNLVLACDIINLIDDSGVMASTEEDRSEDDQSYYQTLLGIYKYKQVIFMLMVLLSARLVYKRPRVSRFVALASFVFGFVVHMDTFGGQMEEHIILEVFVSFFLAAYLNMARVYNLVQLIRS